MAAPKASWTAEEDAKVALPHLSAQTSFELSAFQFFARHSFHNLHMPGMTVLTRMQLLANILQIHAIKLDYGALGEAMGMSFYQLYI